MTSIDIYLRDISACELLSADEERSLLLAVSNGDAVARSRMIRSNLRFVVMIARQYLGNGLTLGDLIGEGNTGLIRAVDKFDLSFDRRFTTYARYWIKEAIISALRGTTPTIHLPVYMVCLLNRWRRAEQELSYPTTDEVEDFLGLKKSQRKMVMQARLVRKSCSEDADESNDWRDSPEMILESEDDRRDLLDRLARLPKRERKILVLRFGLDGNPALTLGAIGKRLNLTRERVRQLERQGLRKLRNDAMLPRVEAERLEYRLAMTREAMTVG